MCFINSWLLFIFVPMNQVSLLLLAAKKLSAKIAASRRALGTIVSSARGEWQLLTSQSISSKLSNSRVPWCAAFLSILLESARHVVIILFCSIGSFVFPLFFIVGFAGGLSTSSIVLRTSFL